MVFNVPDLQQKISLGEDSYLEFKEIRFSGKKFQRHTQTL